MTAKVKEMNPEIENWLKRKLHYKCNDHGENVDISYWGFLQKIITDPNGNEIIRKLKIESDKDGNKNKASQFLERYFKLKFGDILIPENHKNPNNESEYNQMFSAKFVLLCLYYITSKQEKAMKSSIASQSKNSGCMVVILILSILTIFFV